MGEKHTPQLADLPDRIREQSEEAKANLRQWCNDAREDPSMLWRSTVLRVLFWLILGICALLLVRGLSRSLLPSEETMNTEQAAPLATLYVACVNPACLESYATQQAMNFNAWPLTCRKCGQQTVYRAKLCPKCRHWYATAPGEPVRCPYCAPPETEETQKAPKTGPTDPDDAEDPWGSLWNRFSTGQFAASGK